MRSIHKGLFTALLIVGLLAVAGPVWAQGDGIIEGQAVNGTPGGPDVGDGVPVLLHVYRSGTEVDVLETETGTGARFRFEGLDTDPALEYWPEVAYLDMPYGSDEQLRFDGQAATLTVTVTVYETTNDESVVRLDSVHIIAESFGEAMRVSEIHLFGNAGDRAFAGSGEGTGGATVFIPLPAGTVGLAFGEGASPERYIEVGGGLMDTEPVPPGTETSVAFFSYHLMAGGDSVPLERTFAYPVTSLNMLVAQPGLTVNSDQLLSMGTELFQGREYELYVVQNLAPNTPLDLEFVLLEGATTGEAGSGMPAPADPAVAGASTRGNQGLLLWIGFALAGLAVVAAVVYPFAVTGRRPSPVTASNLASNPKARPLLAELADLQEAYEEGRVDEAAYESRRAGLYDELKSL